jgi:hypothetical protein
MNLHFSRLLDPGKHSTGACFPAVLLVQCSVGFFLFLANNNLLSEKNKQREQSSPGSIQETSDIGPEDLGVYAQDL